MSAAEVVGATVDSAASVAEVAETAATVAEG